MTSSLSEDRETEGLRVIYNLEEKKMHKIMAVRPPLRGLLLAAHSQVHPQNIEPSDLFNFLIHKDCSFALGCFYLQLGDLAVSSVP